MKYFALTLLTLALLALSAGCAPQAQPGLVEEPADAPQITEGGGEPPEQSGEPREYKLGAPLFDFYADEAITAFADDFKTNMPDSLTAVFNWYSPMKKTYTDPETITEMFEALTSVVVESPTDVYFTDFDTYIKFTYDDGREYGFSFNGYSLEPHAGGLELYEVSNSEELFKLLNELHEG